MAGSKALLRTAPGMNVAAKDRRVQFACGPWERYKDGHPPEKVCEEERRSYRLGLSLQEPSEFEQDSDWLEYSFQAISWEADSGCAALAAAGFETGRGEGDWNYYPGTNSLMVERHDSATSICYSGPAKAGLEDGFEVVYDADPSLVEKSLLMDDVILSIPSSDCFHQYRSSKYNKMGRKGGQNDFRWACRSAKNFVSGALLVLTLVGAVTVFGA